MPMMQFALPTIGTGCHNEVQFKIKLTRRLWRRRGTRRIKWRITGSRLVPQWLSIVTSVQRYRWIVVNLASTLFLTISNLPYYQRAKTSICVVYTINRDGTLHLMSTECYVRNFDKCYTFHYILAESAT